MGFFIKNHVKAFDNTVQITHQHIGTQNRVIIHK